MNTFDPIITEKQNAIEIKQSELETLMSYYDYNHIETLQGQINQYKQGIQLYQTKITENRKKINTLDQTIELVNQRNVSISPDNLPGFFQPVNQPTRIQPRENNNPSIMRYRNTKQEAEEDILVLERDITRTQAMIIENEKEINKLISCYNLIQQLRQEINMLEQEIQNLLRPCHIGNQFRG